MNISKRLVVSEVVFSLPTESAVHLTLYVAIVSVSHRAEEILVAIAIVAPESEVYSIAGTELQTRKDIEFSVE